MSFTKIFQNKEVISPTTFHTQILNEEMAESFIKKHYCSALSSRNELLNFCIGYFSDLGYIPIPLVKYIFDNFD